MGILGAAILVGLALLALFAALNWPALTAPTALSFDSRCCSSPTP